MANLITLCPFLGYGLSYELLTQFCSSFQKTHPKRSNLLGPICIIPADELSPEETQWLEQQQVMAYEQCVLIAFDGKGSDDEQTLTASTTLWCANDDESFAYAVLPDLISFLSRRAFD